jgi:hypothetical protein
MFSHAGFSVLATSYSRTAYRRTTIGAAAFHFRVRNGNGWGHRARVTRNLFRKLRSKFLVAALRGRIALVVAVYRTAMAIEVNRRYLNFKERRFSGIYIRAVNSKSE